MDDKEKQWIESILSKLEFVQWDRYWTDEKWTGRPTLLTVFGWIERKEDSYKDFVILDFTLKANMKPSCVYFLGCSSAKHSKKIADILGCKHTDCVRVESIFDIDNKSLDKPLEDK